MDTVAGSTKVIDLNALELRTLIEQVSAEVFGYPQSFETLRDLYARNEFPDEAGSLYLKSLMRMAVAAQLPR